MKNYLVLFIFIFSAASLFGQAVNFRLKEMADDKADKLSLKLELSNVEKKQLAIALYESNIELSNAVNSSVQFQTKIEQIKKDRNTKVLKILGENKYKIYQAFEEMEHSNLNETYIALFEDIANNQEYLSEVLNYKIQYILPVLSKFHRDYTNNLSLSDFYAFKNIREKYYSYYDEIKDKGLIESYFYDYLSEQDKLILRTLSLKYDEVLEHQIKFIDPFNQKWTNDLNEITAEYYSDNMINALQSIDQFKAITNIKKRLFKIHFMMIIPGDKNHYLKNLDVITNEEKHFEKLIKELN